MPEHVRITDVSPRDGLQNEPEVIPTRDKVRLVELLAGSGVNEVEVTSFVSPKWVPQLADSREVWQGVAAIDQARRPAMLSALVPNERGMQTAVELDPSGQQLRKVAVFAAASESFSRRNINASIAESLGRFKPVIALAHQPAARRLVRGYISCVIACPFEGPIAPAAVARVARDLVALGVDEIDLGDTIGAATPKNLLPMLQAVRAAIGPEWWTPARLTLHLHDTFGHASECVRAALELGVRSFDGSVAGLGGCPYASTRNSDGSTSRAPGNISTEDLVAVVHAMGFRTEVDVSRLAQAARFARSIVGRRPKTE